MSQQLHQPRDEKKETLSSKASISAQELQNQLVVACEQGDFEEAKKLVAAGAQPHLPNDIGKIPVYCAFNRGDKKENRENPIYPELVNFLFAQIPTNEQKNITPEQAEDHDKCFYITPLQDQLVRACETGDLKGAREILRSGAQPHLPNSANKIPLYCAIYFLSKPKNLRNIDNEHLVLLLWHMIPEDQQANYSMAGAEKHSEGFYNDYCFETKLTK